MKRWTYRSAQGFLRLVYGLLAPIRAEGLEHLPAQGGAILCANHQSLTDPMLLLALAGRPISFMAKKELFSFGPLRAFLRAMGAFPVDRGGNDLSAVRTSLSILKEGNLLGIFPEGHRAYKGKMPFQAGVALIALRAKTPVIPVRIFARARLFRRTLVAFGPAVDLADFAGKMDSQSLQTATTRLREAVYSLSMGGNDVKYL